ncbi:MAG: polymer-forming cytoskeletal protein [Acidobacteria bacterium]|nr:polymer-forming cytoskeletal protein [Acidobacteriota bacterium]
MKTWKIAAPVLLAAVFWAASSTPAFASFVDWLGAEDEFVEMGGTRVISMPTLRMTTDEIALGDVYAAVNEASVAGQIEGDLSLLAQEADVSGRIGADVNAAVLGRLLVGGEIGDDLRGAALQEIVFEGRVGGDAFLAAGSGVTLAAGSYVQGAVAISAARVVIKGRVSGPVRVTAGAVELDGVLEGNALIDCDELRLGPSGRVVGDLVYDARNEVSPPEGFVGGQLVKTELRERPEDETDLFSEVQLPDVSIWVNVYLALVTLFAGVVFLLFLRPLADGAVAFAGTGAGLGASFGIGLVAVLVMLVLGVACFLFLPFALAVWAALGALVYFGALIGKVIIGCLVMRPLIRRQCHPLGALIVGVAVMFGVGLIPYVGDIIWLVVTLTGMGATILQLRDARATHGMPADAATP